MAKAKGSVRQAKVGDVGTVIGVETHGMGSGMWTLIIERTNPRAKVRARAFSQLHGDWRPIRDIYEATKGQRVEIVESEGSAYGCHAVRPLDTDEEYSACKL